jgi:hypothetical protein
MAVTCDTYRSNFLSLVIQRPKNLDLPTNLLKFLLHKNYMVYVKYELHIGVSDKQYDTWGKKLCG